jgi:AMMECR1 domain-containing protein
MDAGSALNSEAAPIADAQIVVWSPFTPSQIGYLVRLARWEMGRLFGVPIEEPSCDRRVWGPAFVNVTFLRNGILCASMGARADHLPNAVRQAVGKACLDDRFGRTVVSSDFEAITIELGLELECFPLSRDRYRLVQELHLGRDGIRIALGSSNAYYKPSVPITNSVRTPYELLGKLCAKAKIPETAWLDPAAELERSLWISALETPGTSSGYVLLQKLRSLSNRSIELDQIRSALKLSIERLIAIQRSDGAFGYLYDPFKDKWLSGANRVRQAGCAYALARAADHSVTSGNPVKESASRVLRYLMERAVAAPAGKGIFVREEDDGDAWGRLGATALTALAAGHSVGKPWVDDYPKLIEQLLSSQKPDGSFEGFVAREVSEKKRQGSQNFAPGESILALTEYSLATGDLRGYASAGQAFAYYNTYFRSNPNTAFIVWQADVWSRIGIRLAETPSAEFAVLVPQLETICQFVFGQIDWMLPLQYNRSHACPAEYLGGFKVPQSPTFSTSAHVEAIIRACDLAKTVGDHSRAAQYRSAALAALEFLMRLQVRPETAPLFPRPKLAVGALTTTLELFEMRCDYEQHFITACLTALDSSCLWSGS